MNQKKLNDIFPEWKIGKGVFYYISILDPPWAASNDSLELDLIYHGGLSGGKLISPFVDNILSADMEDTDRGIITSCAMALYGDNWKRMWDALQAQYEPIGNYSMTEEMTNNKTVHTYGKGTKRTDDITHARTGADARKPSITVTADNGVYGFNSSEIPSPSSKVVETTNGQETMEYGNVLKDTGTVLNEDSGEDTDVNNYTLKRYGNIGVTTSQQMLESEYELRKKNYFSEIVFADLDKLLTLSIY